MALRRTTQTHTTEARLLVLPDRADALRADAMSGFAPQTDEAVMDQSLSDPTHNANRKLRYLIILATALAWLAIITSVRFFFF